MSVLTVGSVALDSIKTPVAEHQDLLGGSASYSAIAASYFAPTRLVGIVGTDFPQEHIDLFKSKGIDIEGLEVVEGKTFRWAGVYHWDMNTRDTLSTELNVFETFSPKLPTSYRDTPIILLANIAPALQSHVLDQATSPKFTIADTMNLWIDIAKDDLLALLRRVNMLILNDGEARQLTAESNLIKAGKAIRALGPDYVAIKKGEHGCLLFGPDGQFFSCGAYPLENIHDPTGAGDTFAGGLAGYLAANKDASITFDRLKSAVVHGSVLASYNVEQFSCERMKSLTQEDIASRLHSFEVMSRFEVLG